MPPRRTILCRHIAHDCALLLSALASAACLANSRRGLGLQYIPVGRDGITGSGFGLSVYELRQTSGEPGWFVDLRGATEGDVANFPRAPDGYDGSRDLVVDRTTSILALNAGPTLRLCDWLHAYGGVGFGLQWDTEVRNDVTRTVTADGLYLTSANRSNLLSSSLGVLLPFADGAVVGIGWDTLLEGPVVTLGIIW